MIEALTKAGPVAGVTRVGRPPFESDDPIEISFASGAVFNIDIGFEAATDISVSAGTLLETAYGHLRGEYPGAFAAIERDWSSEAIDLPWLIGAALSNPRRLAMTNPYRVDVGYVFDVNRRQFALFGEADCITANAFDDEVNESLGLEIGAPYSAA